MDISDVEVIAPNFKRRLSGVTSTIAQLLPVQSRKIGIATVGPNIFPPDVPRLPYSALLKLWRRPRLRPVRIWHARRNTEMLAGLILRDLARMPLRLVFTSAAQRRHKAWTRLLISRMDAVVATSKWSAAYLEVPSIIVMHGVDLDRFGLRGPLPVPDPAPGRQVIGCSGRIRHQKGTDLFVEAMIALLPRHPTWNAIITGRVTAEHRAFAAELERRINEAGLKERIRFVGEVDDIAPWFRRFDILVAPPRNEGFGLTPLEAMASGTPVVATAAGAFRDLVKEGVTGRVVPVGDVGALAGAIEPYLANEIVRQCAGAAALAHVREHFPLSREADELAAVYDAVFEDRVAGLVG